MLWLLRLRSLLVTPRLDRGVARAHITCAAQGRLCLSHDRHALQGRTALSSLINCIDGMTCQFDYLICSMQGIICRMFNLSSIGPFCIVTAPSGVCARMMLNGPSLGCSTLRAPALIFRIELPTA
jgi:hypothetical protein